MELNSNFRKRRLLEDTVSSSNSPSTKRDASTSTIANKPMTFDMWTQTDAKDDPSPSEIAQKIEVKFSLIFQTLSRHSSVLNEILETLRDPQPEEIESNEKPEAANPNVNYKIVANGDDGITIEPVKSEDIIVEHDLDSSNVTYYEHEIEIPREEETESTLSTGTNTIINSFCRMDNNVSNGSNIINGQIIRRSQKSDTDERSQAPLQQVVQQIPETAVSSKNALVEAEKPKENSRTVSVDIEMVPIGSNGTTVPKSVLDSIKWESASSATRRLLTFIFSRDVLATHSLTGRPSPAFYGREKPLKNQLDASKVADIIAIVSKCCNVSEKEVRNAITTKCADENKMYNQRLKKMLVKRNKENIGMN